MSTEKQNPLQGVTIQQMFQDEPIVDETNKDQTQDPPGDDADENKDQSPALDENGNEIKDNADEPKDEPVDLFSQLNQEFGFEFEEEFQEDYDGIKTYMSKASEELAKRQLEELFTAYPAAAQFFDFLSKGGSEEQFFNFKQNTVDFQNLTIVEGDEAMQERIIRMKLTEDGFEEDEIKAKLESYKSAVLLEGEAKSALKVLKKRDESRQAELMRQQEEEAQASHREYQELITSTQNIVKKGVLQNVQIPEKEKKGFIDFLFAPVDKTGKTKRDVSRETLTLEQKLELEYLVYKGMKLSDLITAKKQTQDLSHLRKNADKENAQQQRNGQSSKQQKIAGLPEGMTFQDMFS